jgi:hypothetical protein
VVAMSEGFDQVWIYLFRGFIVGTVSQAGKLD